jgi:hypothetical protein
LRKSTWRERKKKDIMAQEPEEGHGFQKQPHSCLERAAVNMVILARMIGNIKNECVTSTSMRFTRCVNVMEEATY